MFGRGGQETLKDVIDHYQSKDTYGKRKGKRRFILFFLLFLLVYLAKRFFAGYLLYITTLIMMIFFFQSFLTHRKKCKEEHHGNRKQQIMVERETKRHLLKLSILYLIWTGVIVMLYGITQYVLHLSLIEFDLLHWLLLNLNLFLLSESCVLRCQISLKERLDESEEK